MFLNSDTYTESTALYDKNLLMPIHNQNKLILAKTSKTNLQPYTQTLQLNEVFTFTRDLLFYAK